MTPPGDGRKHLGLLARPMPPPAGAPGRCPPGRCPPGRCPPADAPRPMPLEPARHGRDQFERAMVDVTAEGETPSWEGGYVVGMAPPDRLMISTCVGCHSMREYESCEGGCRERRLELVGGDEFDQLIAAGTGLHRGIELLLPIASELVSADPPPDGLRAAYSSVQGHARGALARAALGPAAFTLPPPADPIVVWRCDACGGVDAMEPCLGVCLWRRVEWVEVSSYAAERARMSAELGVGTALLTLVRRIAHATPREGGWQRSWDALRSEATLVLGTGTR